MILHAAALGIACFTLVATNVASRRTMEAVEFPVTVTWVRPDPDASAFSTIVDETAFTAFLDDDAASVRIELDDIQIPDPAEPPTEEGAAAAPEEGATDDAILTSRVLPALPDRIDRWRVAGMEGRARGCAVREPEASATEAGTGAGAGAAALGATNPSAAVHGATGRGGGNTGVAVQPGNARPRYPLEAQRNGWQGVVRVRACVARDGSCADARVEESSGFDALDRAALDAVRRWRFRPATCDGEPIEADVIVPIRFALQNPAR
ncbi:MAG: energy transducer TonB [Planctomycetes bacterium]|nr:energy transducer TonB [Planctomycetota bacterium]MBI3847789.1 energy transducer TonB [Planctomycetota bacterium]